jgi:hypothetical protein
VDDYFADVPYEGQIVRARWLDGAFKLHEGGESYVTLPPVEVTGADHAHARLAVALDAVGDPLHALHRGRGRTSILAEGGRA